MKLEDALFNWLQIRHVAQNRPDDQAAQETCRFFRTILAEEHGVEEIEVTEADGQYILSFCHKGQQRTFSFQAAFVQQLLADIEQEPKYNQ